MISKISNKINLLSQSSKILIVGKTDDISNDIVNKYFTHKEYLDLNENTLNILSENFYEQFNIILFSLDKEEFDIFNKNSIKIPKNSLFIINDELYLDFKIYLNRVSALLIKPVKEDELSSKIYSLLSTNEADKLLKTKEKVINKYKNEDINDDIDTFLDKYSGEIMFINEELNDNLGSLQDLDMSKEVFSNISLSLVKLSNVMKKNSNLLHLSTLFSEFSQFLDALELEKVEPSRYSAFDYLTNIIEDLTIYIDELFVYRLFKDVKVFEDSMSNNINYFESQLFGLDEKDESDNLEFF